ncbi:MAG: hypothetical protein M3P31_07280 [Actinomycetota bacterium]|jgi:hypothetical protein|nr:hypothetical protein [Actinomycetota bacterium]
MNRPIEPSGLAATASKSGEESVQEEREAVGDADEGGLVPPDDAQSAPPAQ